MSQKTGLKRNTTDKYYTCDNIVDICYKQIKKLKIINKKDLIIEPSAGNGAFINIIQKLSNHNLFYDIEPENNNIIKQDFLQLEINKKGKIHIIGNPPFGRQSSLAKKFIKKCCEFADSISFILPKSFKKDSFKSTFDINYHLMYEEDLPENSFTVNGDFHNVPCVFQIWVKKDNPRKVKEKEIPYMFTFVKKSEQPDISFRRVGVYAGKIEKDILNKSIQSHYFIKFNKYSEELLSYIINNITFDFNNTVGPKSISKPELINQFNIIIREFQKSH